MKKRHKGRALKGTNGHEKEAQRQGAEVDKWSGGKLTHLYGRHIRTLHGHEKEAQRQGAEGTNGLVGEDAFYGRHICTPHRQLTFVELSENEAFHMSITIARPL